MPPTRKGRGYFALGVYKLALMRYSGTTNETTTNGLPMNVSRLKLSTATFDCQETFDIVVRTAHEQGLEITFSRKQGWLFTREYLVLTVGPRTTKGGQWYIDSLARHAGLV